ncbi:MAG: hypothetical protein JXR20_03640 [Balneola sp.]
MIRFTFCVIFMFACVQAFSQQRTRQVQNRPPSFSEFQIIIDSIQDPDSAINEMAQFAKTLVNRYPDSTLALAKRVRNFENLSQTKRDAYHNYILTYYWFRPNPDSALFYLKPTLSAFQELTDRIKVLELLVLEARIESRRNNYLVAEEIYLDAINFMQANELNSDNNDVLYNELTDLYMRVGAVDLALERYQQLIELGPVNPDRRCNIILKISNAYKRNQEIEKAKEELLKCEDEEGLQVGLKIAVLRSLGDLEAVLGNPKEQIIRFESAIELEAKSNDKRFTTQLFLAKAYFEDGQSSKVDSMIIELNKQNLDRVQPPARVDFYLLRAKIDLKGKNFNEALSHSEEAVKLAKRLPPTPLLIDAYGLKADALSSLGNYEEAFNITKTINETNNFVKERARISEEAMGKVRFQMTAKNRELQNVTTELGTVKTRNAIITFVLILIGLYVIYRYRIYYLLKEERTRNIIARDLHDDLSATLSSISFFSEAAKRESKSSESNSKFLNRIDESALEAKEKINDIIWAIDPENDDWDTFITKCKRYAAEMFESKSISYDIDIDNDIELPVNIRARKDLWLIFKEIITNLVRHSEATSAKVRFEVNKNRLTICVIDNGIGFDSSLKHKGNGISNIQRRMNLISKKNQVHLNSAADEGTRWELVFNF